MYAIRSYYAEERLEDWKEETKKRNAAYDEEHQNDADETMVSNLNASYVDEGDDEYEEDAQDFTSNVPPETRNNFV